MVTVKDIEDMVERIDARLAPLCDSEGFEPFEGLYRVGDNGYVTEAQCRDAFHGEEPWAEAAYMLAGNGMDAITIARYYRTYGVAGLDALNDYTFDAGMADNVFYTEADEQGMA